MDFGLTYDTIMKYKDKVNEIENLANDNNSMCASFIMTNMTPLMCLFRTLYKIFGMESAHSDYSNKFI